MSRPALGHPRPHLRSVIIIAIVIIIIIVRIVIIIIFIDNIIDFVIIIVSFLLSHSTFKHTDNIIPTIIYSQSSLSSSSDTDIDSARRMMLTLIMRIPVYL